MFGVLAACRAVQVLYWEQHARWHSCSLLEWRYVVHAIILAQAVHKLPS